jgi:tRNA A37 threonylcarbamoyladenosine modification protein TsaB
MRQVQKSWQLKSIVWILTVTLLTHGFIFVAPQTVPAAYAVTQDNFRWRLNDGNEVNASWAAAENTIIEDFGHGESRRLRMGVSNPGSETEFLESLAKSIDLGEDYFWPAVIDQAKGFAYFGTYTQPCQIIKVRLSDFTRVGSLQFPVGENECSSAVIDSANNYAYFGLGTKPGKVVRVNLTTFSHGGTLALNNNEDFLEAATIDTVAGYAYFGTRTSPGRIVKIDLSTFSRVDAITLSSGENNLLSAASDSAYLYFGTNTSPGRVIRIVKNTFVRDAAITFNSGESFLYRALVDESAGYVYFTTFTFPGQLIRVSLNGFYRDSALTLNSGENSIVSAVIDTSDAVHYAYLGTSTSPGQVIKINLSSFSRVAATTLNTTEPHLFAAVMDTANDFIYFGTYQNVPGKIIKVRASDLTRLDSLSSGNGGQNRLGAGVVDSNGVYGYFGTDTQPAKVLKINLSNLSIVSSLTLPSGEEGIQSAVLDEGAGFVYFGTNSSPGKIIKIRLSNLTRVTALTLSSGEDKLNGAAIDVSGTTHYAYFATYTAPMIIVKIDLTSFSRVATLTMQSGEDRNYGAAVLDANNGYAYFGTYTSPGQIIKINLSNFTRNSAITLNSGENNLNSAVIDTINSAAYFSTFTAPGQIVKINLGNFSRADALVLNSGENYPGDGVIDVANGFAYWGTFWEFPSRIIKIRLADLSRVNTLTLANGEDRLWTAVMDPHGGYAYFSSYTNPSVIHKISVAPKYEFQLQYTGKNEDEQCADLTDWLDVPADAAAEEHFQMYSSGIPVSNATPTTNVLNGLTDGNVSFHSGYVMTSNPKTPAISLGESEFTEIEFSVQTTEFSKPYGLYCFRLTNAGQPLDSYAVYGEAMDPTIDPTINNKVLLSRLAANTDANFYLEFTLQNEFDAGTLTINFPSQFTLYESSEGSVIGHGCLDQFDIDNTNKIITARKGNSETCPTTEPIWLSGALIRTPATPGAYSINWTNDDPGRAVVYILDSDQVTITSNVDPVLTFDIDTSTSTSAETSSPYTVDFGTLSPDATNVSGEGLINYILLDLDTNATGGAVVTIGNVNGASGLISTSSLDDTVDSATDNMATGIENYGFCVQQVSQTLGTLAKSGNYTSGTCADTADGNAVKGLSTSAASIIFSEGPIAGGRAIISGSAAISTLTEAHDDYTDALIFVASAIF